MNIILTAEAHIPRGSGDAVYRLVAADGAVVAIVDPNMVHDDPAKIAEGMARAFNRDQYFAAMRGALSELVGCIGGNRDDLNSYTQRALDRIAGIEKEMTRKGVPLD